MLMFKANVEREREIALTALKRQNIGIDLVCLCWIRISKSVVLLINAHALHMQRILYTQQQIGATVHYAALSDFASHVCSSSLFAINTRCKSNRVNTFLLFIFVISLFLSVNLLG